MSKKCGNFKMAAEKQEKSLLKMDKIVVLPLDSKDFNTGRCRMNVLAMKLAGLKPSFAVCVGVKDWKFYCTVWPSLCPNFGAQNFAHVDTSVVLSTDNVPQVGDLKGCYFKLSNDVTRLETCVAKFVETVVYVRVDITEGMEPRLMYDKARRAAQVKCILQDKVFTKHCWVCVKKMLNCGLAFTQEIDRIFINDVEFDGNQVGLINPVN